MSTVSYYQALPFAAATFSAVVGSAAWVAYVGVSSSLFVPASLITTVALGALVGFACSFAYARMEKRTHKEFYANVYDDMRSGALVFGMLATMAYTFFCMARAESRLRD